MSSQPEDPCAFMKKWRTSFYGLCRLEGGLRIRSYICDALNQEEAREAGLKCARLELFGIRELEEPVVEEGEAGS
jgi:hypothetical protein